MAQPKLYDALVVGSGASGGWVAKILTAQGLEVLVLEAGPRDSLSVRKALIGKPRVAVGIGVRSGRAGLNTYRLSRWCGLSRYRWQNRGRIWSGLGGWGGLGFRRYRLGAGVLIRLATEQQTSSEQGDDQSASTKDPMGLILHIRSEERRVGK